MHSVPESFSDKVIRMHGVLGEHWIKDLNKLILFSEAKWACKAEAPLNLSYNYVAPVTFKDGSQGVLKLSLPDKEFDNEINALVHYNGIAFCKLIDSVSEKGILLLERLLPGDTLKSVQDEREAALIAAGIINQLSSVQLSQSHSYPDIPQLGEGFHKFKNHFRDSLSPIPNSTIDKAASLFNDLCAGLSKTYLMHGDMHHENILSAGSKWKLIDPKGIIGEIAFELIPFLVNNLPSSGIDKIIQQRAEILAGELTRYTKDLCLGAVP